MKLRTRFFLLNTLTALALLVVSGIAYQQFNKILHSWHDYQNTVSTKSRYAAEINAALGYGGMIHDFKNYILRGDDKYFKNFDNHANLITQKINAYRSLPDLSEKESNALSYISELLNKYQNAIVEAKKSFKAASGKNPAVMTTAIDQHIALDDSPYLKSLADLNTEIDRAIAERTLTLQVLLEQGNTIIVAVVLGMVALLTMFVVIFYRLIDHSLKRISNHVTNIQSEGDLRAIEGIRGQDEFAQLARAINKMIEKLRVISVLNLEQQWVKTGLSELMQSMRGEQTLSKLADTAVSTVAFYLGMPVGACYIVTEQDQLILKATYALNRPPLPLTTSINSGENLVGQVLKEQKPIMISSIPEGYMDISSGLGRIAPKVVIALPILLEKRLLGVIELGSLTTITPQVLQLLELMMDNIAVAMQSAQQRDQKVELLRQSQEYAERIAENSEELERANQILQENTNELEQQKLTVDEKVQQLESANILIAQKAQEVEQASQYKSQFLANMSHELRTPMNSMLILSKILADNDDGNLTEDEVKYARTIYESGNDLLNLINDVLDLAKVESGKMIMTIESVQVAELMDKFDRKYRDMAQDKGLAFTTTVAENVAQTLEIDGQRMEQVINNFISNAIKFTDQGNVALSVHCPDNNAFSLPPEFSGDGYVMISVSDTGPGIAKDKLDIIFEAFQQADGSTSRQYGGTGLGLSIARELAGFLGGMVFVDSEPDVGSTFHLLIPQRAKAQANTNIMFNNIVDAQPIAQIDHREASVTKQQEIIEPEIKTFPMPQPFKGRILMIEDDRHFVEILASLAAKKGYQMISASNGNKALELVAQHDPDAIFLDICLGDGSGYDVLAAIKASPRIKHIPIYIISIADKPMDYRLLGAMKFITKPISQDDLKEVFTQLDYLLSGGKRHCLVVEDNLNQLESIAALVDHPLVSILSADSSNTAISLIQQNAFSCIILDLRLRESSGYEVIDYIHKNNCYEELPVIVYTGAELEDSERKTLIKLGITVIIKGPNSPDALLECTDGYLCLDRHPLNRAGHQVTDNRANHAAVNNGEALPVAPVSAEQKSAAQTNELIVNKQHKASELKQENTTAKTVLVVDDDSRNIFALIHLLDSQGLKASVARNGVQALQQLREKPDFDLVLMDIMMPEMDGYETIKHIRASDIFAKVRIIALTAKTAAGDRAKCLAAGADEYLPKPVDSETLLAMMDQLFQRNDIIP